MLKNYIKIAFADLGKNKFFSILNISGLALGISLCMIIITIIKNQYSYDTFHPGYSKIFRINTEAIRKNGSNEKYATSPFPLKDYFRNNYSFVEDAVSLTGGLNGETGVNEKTIYINGYFSDRSFFKVFGFKLAYGDPNTALDRPDAIILTRKTSEKLFGKINPIGQILAIKGLHDFIITGVLMEPQGKSHLEFDAIGSNSDLETLEKSNIIFPVINDWGNYYSNYTYVLLKDKAARKLLESNIAELSKIKYNGAHLAGNDKGYKFYAQGINKIVPGPELFNNMGKALPEEMLWYLFLIGVVVILSAGFNYSSLSLAQSLSRSKEIGIRKSLGAKKYQLVIQFLVQSVVTCLVAMVIAALFFHYLLRPFFESIELFKMVDIVLYEDPSLYLLFTFFSILVGVFSGIFPALYLARFNPLKVLKQNAAFSIAPKLGFRKILFTVQFAIAVLFVVGLINIYRQVNHVLHADYGFRKHNMININLDGNDYSTARNALMHVNGVSGISANSHSMGTTIDRGIDVSLSAGGEKTRIRDFTIDEHYLENFKLKLIAGNNFSQQPVNSKESGIIVNEAFIKMFRLGDAYQSVGKRILLGDSLEVSITGVLQDFNFQPLTKAIAPLIFRYNINDLEQLNVAVDNADVQGTLVKLAATWKKLYGTSSFKYRFLEDELQQAYRQFASLPDLLMIVALISVMVAALGLLGLTAFTLKQRIKEMSIRKILGASVTEISFILSKGFIRLIVTGLVIGLPLAVYLDSLFLKNFVYKINPLWGYLSAIALLFVIVFLSIGIQIIKTARVSPVNNLKAE
jgi:putative ABC transport system permease protein